MNLPDNLTTWQVLVRGLTKDTQVGETQLQVITTSDLLIRPVTPRFLVVGDHAQLAAVVQNNTTSALQGTATLQATGFVLDDPNTMTQQVTLPANGRLRLEWWGTVEDVPSASLRFSVQAGNLTDAILVSKGALPILRYTAPRRSPHQVPCRMPASVSSWSACRSRSMPAAAHSRLSLTPPWLLPCWTAWMRWKPIHPIALSPSSRAFYQTW